MMNLGKRSKSIGFTLTKKKKKFLRHKFISFETQKMVSVLFNRFDLLARYIEKTTKKTCLNSKFTSQASVYGQTKEEENDKKK